ncbi:MAG: hypothetical protein AWU57_278 [Marinobacter sp. T13-3]|nr:MAG: hypothetical protein AWU57_278 [Marinobacter sp. T13-3]
MTHATALHTRFPNASDKTDYARSMGYQGERPVLVSDGRVVSHRNQDWFEFCAKCRKQKGGGL